MPEQDPMDALLRRVLTASPAPALPADFDRRLLRRLRPRRLDARGRLAMAAYTLMALAVSIGVMRAQGLDWSMVAIAVLAPVGFALAVHRRQRYRGV